MSLAAMIAREPAVAAHVWKNIQHVSALYAAELDNIDTETARAFAADLRGLSDIPIGVFAGNNSPFKSAAGTAIRVNAADEMTAYMAVWSVLVARASVPTKFYTEQA